MTQKKPELICEDKIDPKTKKHLLVCSINFRRQAGKHVSDPIKLLMQGKYFKKRNNLHKALDVIGVITLILTLLTILYLALPKNTPNLITIDSSIAPEQIITGDLSTLTFRYENNSDETIKNARLEFKLPKHFKLQEIDSAAEKVGSLIFDLDQIAPTEYGYIHVKGAMFGDVGGDQIFTTSLTYTYSEENIQDIKIKEHIFQPTKSALELKLSLPEHLIAYQQVSGEISYTNTGSIEFPNMIIEPNWPETFTLISSSPTLQTDGKFHINGIEQGETGVISFTGRLGSENDSIFDFNPSFSIESETYTQTKLTSLIEILPTPLQLSHAISENSITPGSNITIELAYENVSDYELTDINFKISNDINIFQTTNIENGHYQNGYYYFNEKIESLLSNEKGITSITLPVLNSLSRSLTDIYESINITTNSSAEFKFTPDNEIVTVNTLGSTFSLPLTSPIVLSSFGRYWGPSGDQLGRGPIPPIINETTKYWIFWNLNGTTNTLSNINISANLGENVELTGKQSTSIGSSISSTNGTVTWSIDSLEPTLPPASFVAGIAFEVAITPTEDQINTTPILLGLTSITASDDFTNTFISSNSSNVTTLLLYDTKASSYGGIVEN